MFEAVAVVIEVPRDTPAELGAALVMGCSAALGQGQCRLSISGGPGGRWLGVVSNVDSRSLPKIMLQLHPERDKPPIATRKLEFSNHDGAAQQWESVGAVLAAMVAGQEALLAATPPAPPEPKPLPPPQPAKPPPKPVTTITGDKRFSWGVGASLGSGTTAPSLRTGGLVRFSYDPMMTRWGVTGAAASDTTLGDPAFVGIAVSAGVTLRVTPERTAISVRIRAEGMLRLTRASVSDPAGRLPDQLLLEPQGGGRGAVDFGFQLSPNLSLALSPEALLNRPTLNIEIGEQQVVSVPALGWNVTGLVRHHF